MIQTARIAKLAAQSFIAGSLSAPPLTCQLRELLSWCDDSVVSTAIHRRHLTNIHEAVVFWLALVGRNDVVREEPLAIQFRELPKASQKRLLTAPEIYHRLAYTLGNLSAGTIDFFADCLRAERCMLGSEFPPARSLWTARGDVCFLGPTEVAQRRWMAVSDGALWRAPTIPLGPAIDGLSPYCTIDQPSGTMKGINYSPRELARIASRIGGAVTRIRATNDLAFTTLCQFTAVIVCKKIIEPNTHFASASCPAFVGKTTLINAHKQALTFEHIANALIHEAIHAVLFVIESCEPFLTDSVGTRKAFAVSPWSQRTLPIRNYIHACFVWFGLWCFWRLAKQSGAFTPAGVTAFLDRGSIGFQGPSLLNQLVPMRRHIAPAVLDAIRELQETVQDYKEVR